MPNLKRIMAPGGVVAFTVPFIYQFHPMPGDFYRYSPMALVHMFESSGFAVCQIVSSGWRSVQSKCPSLMMNEQHPGTLTHSFFLSLTCSEVHALGLEMPDIDGKVELLTKKRSLHSLMIGAADYALVAQKLRPGDSLDQGCTLERMHLTNEILVDDLKAFTKKGFWPEPMPNFPY
jgi:hypothetical protein